MGQRRWSKDRVVTAAILSGASAIMLWPLLTDWFIRPVPVVSNLGFTGASLAPLSAWAAALLFALCYIAFTFWALPSVRRFQKEGSLFKLIGVVAALASGIMEEVVFRRLLMDYAQAWGLSEVWQVVLSGVVFGLAHGVWHLFSAHRQFAMVGIAATTVAGMALAGLYLLANRSLGPPIAAHVLINLVIEPWLVLAAVSGAMGIPRTDPSIPER